MGMNFLFSAVYGHPAPALRNRLWQQLMRVQEESVLPWVLMGDFNAIAQNSERAGGSDRRIGVNQQFVRWIHTSRLVDLGFLGPKFTWKRGSLCQRLDRSFCSSDWRVAFPEASVTHLARYQSDHRLLLLKLCSYSSSMHSRPFRFIRAWMSQTHYDEFVRSSWLGDQRIMDSITEFTKKVQVWNKEVFGNIFYQKRKLYARIAGIQKALENRGSSRLKALEVELKQELDVVLLREESLWHQKSRGDWIQLGDRNTSFFHLRTVRRRKRSRIELLQNENGDWVSDQSLLQKMAISFYEELYRETDFHRPLYMHRDCFLSIDQGIAERTSFPFRPNDVKDALFAMKPWKAPGVDGFQAGFYQRHWETVGSDICAEVLGILEGELLDDRLNRTMICLIPKVEAPNSLAKFRPIALCSVIYKLVTKTIANRLKQLMPLIIGPAQSSFVAGRHISDNIVIAQEAIHSMRNKSGRTGTMALKVDLEKAYDRVSWAFLFDTLNEAKLSTTLVDVIMKCVSTSSMQLLWNGNLTESFKPSRGLRQGCPLSPYLFVLCMERLANGIEHAVRVGEWNPFLFGKNGPSLTHLFFADDLLLFGQADVRTAEAFSNVLLDEFCGSSGMKVSTAKTSLFFTKNVDIEKRRIIKNLLGVRVVNDLGQYLGVLLLRRKVSKLTYAHILDKMKAKIANWNTAQLSLAGRITLAQAILSTMPLYAMQTSKLPVGVCAEMGKEIRGFIWGSDRTSQRLSKVAWSKVSRPKDEGGLGLRKLSLVNFAFGMKACWEIFKQPMSLWATLLCSKYKFDPLLGFDPVAPASCTPFWRLICGSWDTMRRNLVWALGTGSSVQFWNQRWVPALQGPLSEVVIQRIPDHLLYRTVDFFVEDSAWAWSKFSYLLLASVLDLIAAIMPPGAEHEKDEVFWGLSSSGMFSIKSAYDVLVEGQRSQTFLPWKRIWSWYGPQRIKNFFWLLLNNGVLTNAERARRHISPSAMCSMCGCEEETALHMLRDCIHAKRIWEGLLRYGEVGFFDVALNMTDWIIQNISSKILLGSGVKWCTVYGVGCWQIWKRRCGFIFKGERISPIESMTQIVSIAKTVEEARMTNDTATGVARLPTFVSWRPPLPDILKLNTDASLEGGSGHAFGGGLIRDTAGTWRYDFVANIGVCSILTAEIWCLFHGLQLAKSMGIRKLEVESDSFTGVSMILGNFEVTINCRSIVRKVQSLLIEFDSVVLRHVHREGNFAADFLSHYAYNFHKGVHVLESPPLGLSIWLMHDRLGVSYVR